MDEFSHVLRVHLLPLHRHSHIFRRQHCGPTPHRARRSYAPLRGHPDVRALKARPEVPANARAVRPDGIPPAKVPRGLRRHAADAALYVSDVPVQAVRPATQRLRRYPMSASSL